MSACCWSWGSCPVWRGFGSPQPPAQPSPAAPCFRWRRETSAWLPSTGGPGPASSQLWISNIYCFVTLSTWYGYGINFNVCFHVYLQQWWCMMLIKSMIDETLMLSTSTSWKQDLQLTSWGLVLSLPRAATDCLIKILTLISNENRPETSTHSY